MTHRGLPRNCLLVAALCMGNARAAVWITEPVAGLTADYSSNPALLYAQHSSQTRGALLIDAPTTYREDAINIQVLPSVRVGNSAGYSSLTSDYARLTLRGEIDSERNSLTVTGQTARDSSLYYNYGLNGSTGVRRDTLLGDISWTRTLTERFNVNTDFNSSRVNYATARDTATLTNYRYSTAAPSIAWAATERSTFSISGDTGLYNSADGATKSINYDIQLGGSRQLTELWSATGSAGYSKEINSIDQFFGRYFFRTYKSQSIGSVFTAGVTRQGQTLTMTASVKRSLVPSGFAFLSRQDSYQFAVHYDKTERWSFDGHVGYLKSIEPVVFGPSSSQSYLDLGVSAAWLVTEKCTVTARASRISAKYTPPAIDVLANGVTVQLSWRFDPIKWH